MKIYHEDLETVPHIQNEVDKIFEVLPPGLEEYVIGLAELTKKLIADRMFEFMEKEKYRLMWRLRSLEKEIEAEDGMFILKHDGSLQMKDFSDSLMRKVRNTLREIKE